MKQFTFIFFMIAFFFMGYAQNPWNITGNNNTTTSNFIGTTITCPLIFKTNNLERMRLLENKASLGIGISTPQATLHLHDVINTGGTNDGVDGDGDGGDTLARTQRVKLLQLTTNKTGSGYYNGFSTYSDAYGDVIFKQ